MQEDDVHALHRRLDRIERLLGSAEHPPPVPAWRRATRGEPRWAVSGAVAAAVVLQTLLPDRLAFHPHWMLPGLEILLLVLLLVADPHRIERASGPLRLGGITLAAAVSLANGWSAVLLIQGLIRGTEGGDAGPLLMTGAGIWLTNVIVFALWYWEWDRSGPAHRALGTHAQPDFLFPQMQNPEAAEHWEPAFADYLYVSFTNAAAFSPTDTMPLSRWAKLLMAMQSAISLLTMALVIARAVNILK